MSFGSRIGLAAAVSAVGLAGVGLVLRSDLWPWLEVLTMVVSLSLLVVAVVVVGVALKVWRTGKKKAAQPRPLLSVRFPELPRSGHIDNFPTIYFDKVLVTNHTTEPRPIRFALSIAGYSFVDIGEFQAIYQERPGIHRQYLSNPLDVTRNHQGVLAFVYAPGPGSLPDAFEISVFDSVTRNTYTIASLGEHVLCADGTAQRSWTPNGNAY